jgi:hypothetical protein
MSSGLWELSTEWESGPSVVPVDARVVLDGSPILPGNVAAPVKVTRGRSSVTQQFDAGTAELTLLHGSASVGQLVQIRAGGLPRLTGRVTDVKRDIRGRSNVTIAGAMALLGSARLGSEPWPSEPLNWRIFRLGAASEAAGVFLEPMAVLGFADLSASATVAGIDLDSASPLDVWQELAARTGCLFWEAADGATVWEYPLHRETNFIHAVAIPPEAVSAVGLQWQTAIGDVVNMANVRWSEQGTMRDALATDPVSFAEWGPRSVGFDSLWTSSTVALSHANRIVTRWSVPRSHVGSVTILRERCSPDLWHEILRIDISDPVILPLTDEPSALMPNTVWIVEGLSESISGGDHEITLTVSPGARWGLKRLRWKDWLPMSWSQLAAKTWMQRMETTT